MGISQGLIDGYLLESILIHRIPNVVVSTSFASFAATFKPFPTDV